MKRIISILLIVMLIFTMVGCAKENTNTDNNTQKDNVTSSTDNEKPAKTDFVIGVQSEAVTLDPQGGWDGASLILLRQLYNGLVKLNDKLEVVGDLAESWNFTSDTSVTFNLKKGVKFHNGEEMKASDVVYSIQRAQQSPKVKSFTANIESVVANGDYEVTINTSIPYAPLMQNLCHTANSIVSQKAVEAAGDNFSKAPVGTGPFKFVKWDSGDKIVVTRNDDYFAGQVLPTSLTFKLMAEGSARTIALETGDIDFNMVVLSSDAKRVNESATTELVVSMSPKIEYVSFNQKKAPFDNEKVRQAINYAIDKDSLNVLATEGYSTVTDSVMNSQIKGYTDNIQHYDYNVEKAKSLLAEAGYENGFSTSILVSGNTRKTEAVWIQSCLKEINIDVQINELESTTLLEQVNNGDYEMFIMSYNNTTGDPDTSLYMLFNSNVPASSGNRSFTNIPEIDQWLEAGRSEIDETKRLEYYANIQKLLTEKAVWVPLYNVANMYGLHKGLQGFTTHPLGNEVYDQLHY